MPTKVLGHQPADLSCVMPVNPGVCLWFEVIAAHNGDLLSFCKFLLEALSQGLSSVYLVGISLQARDPVGLDSLKT